MDKIKFCHLCLVLNSKLSRMTTSTLETYSRLLRLPLCNDEPYICYECSGLLLKYQQFHTKCTRAHNVLSHLKLQYQQVTEKELEDNRKIYKLESKLSQSPVYNEKIDPEGDRQDDENRLSFKVESVDCQLDSQDVDEMKTKTLYEHVIISDIIEPCEFDECSIKDSSTVCNEIEHTSSKIKIEIEAIRPKEEEDEDVDEEDVDVKGDSVSDTDDEPIAKRSRKSMVKVPKNIKKPVPKKKLGTKTKPKVKKEINTSDVEKPLLKRSILSKKHNKKSGKGTKVAHGNISIRKKSIPIDLSFCEGYAEVVLLTPEEAKKEILLRKETSNYINSPYKCELCYRGFLLKSTFDNHMKKHSQTYGSLECQYCLVRYPTRRRLVKHITAYHLRKFNCIKCEHVCFEVQQAKAHIKAHEGKKYPCNECGKQFSLQHTLLNHKNKKHPKECVCALCGSAFGTQHGLLLHRQFAHKQESPALSGPRCADCAVQFATETAYKRHLVVSDKHIVINGCDVCGETFANKEDLKIHSRIHVNEGNKRKQCSARYALPKGCPKPPTECPLCDKWLSTVREVKAHLTSEHPHSDLANKISAAIVRRDKKQYVCEVCGEQFKKDGWHSSAKAMNMHIVSQHPLSEAAHKITARNKRMYVCEICGKGFKNRGPLKDHLLQHSGSAERPHQCAQCGERFAFMAKLYAHRMRHRAEEQWHQCHMCPKGFKLKIYLNRHLKTHLGVRPYGCEICGKGFLHPCDVKTHIKYTHDKVPWPSKKKTKPPKHE